MPPSYFPLRWESTGDKWWYASPIDWAAANGLYDLVIELLHLDNNLLIKLTSLRRIRRLETVWDDEDEESQFADVAKCRSLVARRLLRECETKKGDNTLVRAGYGGWLMYTAASAGDINFVKELLEKDPFLVFGEGEYGVTDMFYAAARGGNSEVFKMLLDFAVSSRSCLTGSTVREEVGDKLRESNSVFKWEMMNRAVHAAARGGSLEILKEILKDCGDVLVYRDVKGSTILHSASGRGQVQVVKDLVASYNIITSTDNQGNTALHVAAYRGYSKVVEFLIHASPNSASAKNNSGNTFLHMVVSGFRTPDFQRMDRQTEMMKQLVRSGVLLDIINVRNLDGRTALHMAVTENVQSEMVELLMTVKSIDLNVLDSNGMTPLDLLRRRPRSVSSEVLIKELTAAGGIVTSNNVVIARRAIVSHLRGRKEGIVDSPGTSFRIPDAEIFLYTGTSEKYSSYDDAGYSSCLSEVSDMSLISNNSSDNKKSSSITRTASRLKFLLQWPGKKERKAGATKPVDVENDDDDDPLKAEITSDCRNWSEVHIPLRQKYSKNNKLRAFSMRSVLLPSRSSRKKFTTGLSHGVIQAAGFESPRSPFSGSISSRSINPSFTTGKTAHDEMNQHHQKQTSIDKRLMMNQYFCFGAQGLDVEGNNKSYTRLDHSIKRVSSLVA